MLKIKKLSTKSFKIEIIIVPNTKFVRRSCHTNGTSKVKSILKLYIFLNFEMIITCNFKIKISIKSSEVFYIIIIYIL